MRRLRTGLGAGLLAVTAGVFAGGWAIQAHAQSGGVKVLQAEIPVDHPWWTCPDPQSPIPRYYPPKAQNLGIEGKAEVECRTNNLQKMRACAWISETPPGHGFGEAAEKLACLFKFSGSNPSGDIILQTPVNFTLR
jgi:hypothetical protein